MPYPSVREIPGPQRGRKAGRKEERGRRARARATEAITVPGSIGSIHRRCHYRQVDEEEPALSSVLHPKTTAKFDAAAADAKLSNLAASCCRATRELEFLSSPDRDSRRFLSLSLSFSASLLPAFSFLSFEK